MALRSLRGLRVLSAAMLWSVAPPMGAGAVETLSDAAFRRDPARFVGREIRLLKVGCFSSSPETGLRCTTYGGIYLLASDIEPAGIKAKIHAECGGLVEDEDDPSCTFDAVFMPASVSRGKGQVTKGDTSVEGPVWMVRAGTVTLTRRR